MPNRANTDDSASRPAGSFPLKIAHVVPRYFPALGGVEEFVRRCAELQARRGHKVFVITSDLIRPRSSERLPVGVESREDVKVFRCPAYVVLPGKFYFVQRGILSALARAQPDVIHLHGNKCFGTDLVAVWCRLKRRPFVFSPHAGKLGSTLAGRIHNRTVGRAAFGATAVHVVSESERALVENSIRMEVRLAVIPPGIDFQEIEAVQFDIYERRGIQERLVVLGVGRLETNKGFDVLVKALARLQETVPDIRLMIVGEDFGAQTELQALAQRLGVSKSVTFAGRLTREELISAFKRCAVFCHPARTEGFGIVVAEALACGAPVVASRIPVMQELIGNDERGLSFEPQSDMELAEQLCRLLRDPELRSRLSAEGQKFVRALTWENTVSNLEELYDSLRCPGSAYSAR